jgi:dTDP-4-dehydrorhamnose reductase
MTGNKILFTGGSGLLGKEVKKLLPNAQFPSSSDLNIVDFKKLTEYILINPVETIIHAAAFTSPPLIDKEPEKAIYVNIVGTCNIVNLCMKYDIKMIYISTDYVFNGEKGNYKEKDLIGPINKYAWSKMGGECAVMLYDNSLIVRTSFSPNKFQYDKAFIDQWTSRESVRNISKKIVKLIDKNVRGIIHVGGKRKTVYEYAKSLDEEKKIGKLSIYDSNFALPVDTSLDSNRYEKLIKCKGNK